jgi:hypothetical protein
MGANNSVMSTVAHCDTEKIRDSHFEGSELSQPIEG